MRARFGPVRPDLGLAGRGRHGFALWFSWTLPQAAGGGVHGPWPDWLGHRIRAGEPRSGGRLAHPTRVLHGSTCWRHGGAIAARLVDRLLPSATLLQRFPSLCRRSVMVLVVFWRVKIMDAGAAALEDGPHRRIYGE
jgi:hypothetical protein